VILRDENGVEWECTEVLHWPLGDATENRDYRVLRCVRVNCPEAPRYISVPFDLYLGDPSVLRRILSKPRKRE
jgi:hypothetical protein